MNKWKIGKCETFNRCKCFLFSIFLIFSHPATDLLENNNNNNKQNEIKRHVIKSLLNDIKIPWFPQLNLKSIIYICQELQALYIHFWVYKWGNHFNHKCNTLMYWTWNDTKLDTKTKNSKI